MSPYQNENVVSYSAFKEHLRRRALCRTGTVVSESQSYAELKARLKISRKRIDRLQKSSARIKREFKALSALR